MPIPVVRAEGLRRGNSPGGAVAPNARFTVAGQASSGAGLVRATGTLNDGGIRRDRTAWYPTDRVSGVGTGTVNWTDAGPPRPELHVRNVTVRTMAGTSRTRALANPLDPSVGLHSPTRTRSSGNLERYQAGGAAMRPARANRLSPARYAGQSYSQTTVLQGARR
jgi:hypothetical protein